MLCKLNHFMVGLNGACLIGRLQATIEDTFHRCPLMEYHLRGSPPPVAYRVLETVLLPSGVSSLETSVTPRALKLQQHWLGR
ncbi:hypothetical protein Tco_0194438 [Tanacetum coccineum]